MTSIKVGKKKIVGMKSWQIKPTLRNRFAFLLAAKVVYVDEDLDGRSATIYFDNGASLYLEGDIYEKKVRRRPSRTGKEDSKSSNRIREGS